VATSRKWTDASGQLKEETAWFRVSVWGKQAEACNQYLAKGRKVLVEGDLMVDEKRGTARLPAQRRTYGASFEIRATTVRFLSPKGEGSDNGGGGGISGVSSIPSDVGSMSEEELPFNTGVLSKRPAAIPF